MGYNDLKAAKARKETEQTLRTSFPVSSQPQVNNFEPKFEDVNSRITQLESELAAAKQKLAVYEQK